MKVIFAVSNVFRILGGAALSSLTFLQRLQSNYGYSCTMLTQFPTVRKERYGNVNVRSYRDLSELKEFVVDIQPDLIIGSLKDALGATRVARHFGIPPLVYIHSYEFCEPTEEERLRWQLPSEANFLSGEEARYVLENSAGVLVCSQHMQDEIAKRYNTLSEVLYYDFDPTDFMICDDTPRSTDYITAICGYRHKGIEIFLDLAEAFPHEKFILIGALGSDIDLSYREKFSVLPNLVLGGRASPKQFLALSKVVLVPSQWPEPFGRIAVEAMANGIPTVVSYNGGLQEIVGSEYPLAIRDYQNVDAWKQTLRRLLNSVDLQRSASIYGRSLVDRFLTSNSTALLETKLRSIARQSPVNKQTKSTIVIFGSDERQESCSLVNSIWTGQLTDLKDCTVSSASEFDVPDIAIHHDYKQHFTEFQPPETGKCVAVRTSDFGPYPPAWAEKINAEFDQLWVHTRWIKEQAIASGIDPARIHVVPHGIDPEIYSPDGPSLTLPTEKRFKFLFVGVTTLRKGIDILLRGYREAFTHLDDVCLVIKDHSGNAFHSPEYSNDIRSLLEDRAAPELFYIDEFLPVGKLVQLYRACDVAVFPYRAEGFALPILEAMACGTPAIVPNLGASTDYCREDTSFVMPAKRIRLPVNKTFGFKIGFQEHVDFVDFCEVPVKTLVETLRLVYTLPETDLKLKATAGVQNVREKFTSAQVLSHLKRAFRQLNEHELPVRIHRLRQEAEKENRKFEAALKLAVKSIGTETWKS